MTKPEENNRIRLSVVIAAWNEGSSLRRCLSSLQNQIKETGAAAAEAIVVSSYESETAEIKRNFPFAEFFILSEETTVPQLRAFGIGRASGEIIALTEDFCFFDSNWRREIELAHETPNAAVIGGAVENAGDSNALDWAVYFFDYGKYAPTNPKGETNDLSGANVSYKKKILEQVRENYETEFFETFINEELKRRGHELHLQPSAVVFHNKTYEFKKIVSQFYHQARSFAARRVTNFSFLKKSLFIAASPFLPILLFARLVFRAFKKKGNLKELAKSLPFLIILTSVWGFGEFCGYSAGEGKSGRHWK